jgi:CheY-like chemotaxis protein
MGPQPILLVEDNDLDEMLTLRAFRDNGLERPVLVVRDGQQAVDYLADDDKALPALVLLDLKLPKLGGFEVLQRMRAAPRTRWVPVVVLTSSLQADDLRESYRLGANSYVGKALDYDRFSKEIGALLRYWLAINQSPQPDKE